MILTPGMYLQDRYEILELIGSGGMSYVYKAKCHKLNRLVAIKVLKNEFSMDANFVSKFKMEAQAAAGLSHPNIVSVYDVIDEGDIHYIVMELIEGITLKNYIQKKGKLEVTETIGIAIQVAQGIAAAHEQHIIHRDIKPQNMIISRDGKVKVADFGIARAVSSQTMSSSAMGSVHYISPEQARGGRSDERSDIYSLGITMYEMVTGRLPFEGDNTVTVALAHLEEPITPPSVYNPNIPVSLEKIILRCTEKNPKNRYPGAAELIGDLRHALLNPDVDFVKKPSTVKEIPLVADQNERVNPTDSGTIMINEEEMRRIKAGSTADKGTGRQNVQKKPLDDDSDVNPQIEKLLTVAGIGAAVIIVVVLILVFMKLGGIFRVGSGGAGAETTATHGVLSDTEVYMPNVLGLPSDMAEAKLKDSTLVMKISGYEYSDKYDEGEIMSQANEPDSIIPKYSSVSVVVSNGDGKTKLSTLKLEKMEAEAAKKLLVSQKFVVETVDENSDTIDDGHVISYSPDAAKEGDTITLYISAGPEEELTDMPNIVGQTAELAKTMLEEAGLAEGTVRKSYSDTIEKGLVMNQEVAQGSQVAVGSAISYTISLGVEEETTAEQTEETTVDPVTQVIETEAGGYHYIGSISESYSLADLIGPGSSLTSVQIMIRLRQRVEGRDVMTVLMPTRTISGNTELPVIFSKIEGAYGVEKGYVDIIDVGSNSVLKSYSVEFFRVG